MPTPIPAAVPLEPIARGPAPRGGWAPRLLGIDVAEAEFARRDFSPGDPSRRERLEEIGRTFITGYNTALRLRDPDATAPRFDATARELQGFAFEGAAMGFALLDILTPWPGRRFLRFIAGWGGRHIYMAYVGAGWALARTSLRLVWRLGPLDPLLRWLMIDGFGFHAGYFHHRETVDRHRRPRALQGSQQNVFDQGLGRALWFVKGADIDPIAAAVATFPRERRADLWSGVGLAAAYAGGINLAELSTLRERAGAFAVHLAQGAAFAAKARQRAGNEALHANEACHVLAGCSAEAAAAITDEALAGLPRQSKDAYETWRQRIRAALTSTGGADEAASELAEAIRR